MRFFSYRGALRSCCSVCSCKVRHALSPMPSTSPFPHPWHLALRCRPLVVPCGPRAFAAGFTIHKSENDALYTPKGPPLSPDIIHATTVGEPYNLWCVYHRPPPSPPIPATLAAAPPTPPPTDESGTAVPLSVPPNEAWRLRRRYLSRKQRTARRLAEEKRRLLQRSRVRATLR